jgi:hypothetical protein
LLLESESHTVFIRETLVREENAQLTVTDCYAGYVEFCNERGWRALTRNKFGAVIGDAVVHQFGITPRHDIVDGKNNHSAVGRISDSVKFAGESEKKSSELVRGTISDTLSQLYRMDAIAGISYEGERAHRLQRPDSLSAP